MLKVKFGTAESKLKKHIGTDHTSVLRDEVIVQKSKIYFQQCRNSLSAVMQFTFSIFLTISIAQPLRLGWLGPFKGLKTN